MFNLTYTITGASVLIANLPKLPKEAIQLGLEDSSEYVQLAMQTYPGYRYVPMEFVSDKQRRYVMAAIRDGRITIPYNRTGNLAASWTKSISGYTATIEAGASYAHWVQGEDQARQMSARGWTTAKQFVANSAGQILHMFEVGVRRAIAMLGLN